MKNKQKRNFKIIPFCISLLMVILVTGGIGIYTTFYYGQTDIKFLDKYLDVNSEENKNLPTDQFLDKAIQLENLLYSDADIQKDLGLSYRDPKTKKTYTAEKFPSFSDGNTLNFHKNNVMHIEGYFDLELKVLITETEDEKGQKVKSLEYVFYFYNMDYTKMGFESSYDPQEKIRIAFVDGVNNKTEDEFEEDEAHTGNLALEEMMNDDTYAGDPAVMKYEYGYYKGNKFVDVHVPVYDRGAVVDGENLKVADITDPVTVYKCNISVAQNTNGQYFDDLDSATFCIYLLNDGQSSHTTLVEGTVANILSLDDLNENTFEKGYNNALHTVPSFLKYTWTTVILFTGIALILSTVLATLFYMIWIDEKQPTKNKSKK